MNLKLHYVIVKCKVKGIGSLDHIVKAILPGDEKYNYFFHGTKSACQEYVANLTPEEEERKIAEIIAVNLAG